MAQGVTRPGGSSSQRLISPSMMSGPELEELRTQHWDDMRRTRDNAQDSCDVIAGVDAFVLPETVVLAGAEQWIGSIPHPRTVPQRVLQKVISKRPHLSIPLGPKGLGITGQRLTTRVEQPLNAICEDKKAGFQWARACALLTFEGFCASVTVLDPSNWRKNLPSQWEDEDSKTWKKRYYDEAATEDADETRRYEKMEAESKRAKNRYELDLAVHRARNVPIRHRAIGIRQCAPIFDGDTDTVGGLIISQEFSESYLKRRYRFGEAGVLTPTGSNGQDGTAIATRTSARGGMLTLIEAWLYDEDGIPYVTYCVKGSKGALETYWKDSNELAVINLKERYGLDRLPVTWRFGLGNPGEINADLRAMGLIEPFAQGWRSVRAKLTAMNMGAMWMGMPALIEESDTPMAGAGLDDQEPSNAPDILPMKITEARPGTRLRALQVQPFSPAMLEMISLELGAQADESPGKSNKDQSGFSQSLAEAFEELALTSVKEGLGELYEEHGSFVLEAGKRLPEHGKRGGGGGYDPIMVFDATDVPVNESGEKKNRDPMELDPDLIDETFTTIAQYTKSMSIPETQQSMEEVARNLKTRRRHLEDTGDSSPETTELELMLEAIRATPEYQKYALGLMAKVQGSEELEAITAAQAEGLADEDGMGAGLSAGVMPALPPGVAPPLQQGAPGVPDGGSVTGLGAPQYGQNQLAGIVGGATMTGPANAAEAAGGVLPPTLPTGGV